MKIGGRGGGVCFIDIITMHSVFLHMCGNREGLFKKLAFFAYLVPPCKPGRGEVINFTI